MPLPFLRRSRPAAVFAFVGLTALLLLGTPPVDAAEDAWRKKLTRLGDLDGIHKTILQIQSSKDPSALLPLMEMLAKVEHPHIAVAAGDAVRGMDPKLLKTKGPKKQLRSLQKSKLLHVQQNAARFLAGWGDPALDDAFSHFCEGRRDPSVQAEALFMAGSLPTTDAGKDFPKVVKAVMSGVKKGRTEEVKCAACSAAGRLRVLDAADDLMSLATRSRDDYAGLYAVWALKTMGYREGLGSFLHVLKSNPKRRTREACLKGVTELATLDDVEELLTLSRHGKTDYRDAAALALARMAWRAQRGRLLDKEGKPVANAAPITGTPGGRIEPDIFKKHELPRPKWDVPDNVIRRMLDMVEDDDWQPRDAARQALINFGEKAQPAVQETVPAWIAFRNEDAAITAMELAGIFEAKEAARDLAKTAVHDDTPVKRMFAARALENCDPAQGIAYMENIIKPGKRARDAQLKAVRALGYIRQMPALELLLGMIETGEGEGGYNEPMMRECELALERLTGHRFGRKPERWRKWLETAKHPLHPGVVQFDRKKNRSNAKKHGLYGLTPATESSVENGLRWLELQQHTLGTWDGAEKGFGGVTGCLPAYTGLSLLAYLGAGYQAKAGKYRETVRRSAEFLCATQFYDGSFPVTGGGDDSWIYAYLIAMAVWGINETYVLSDDPVYAEPAQWGIDYLVRVQTPGAGWRYGPRYIQSDTSCTSWVMMTVKTADLAGLQVAQRCYDGIDDWLERCSLDITGEEEVPEDLATDYDFEVGARRYFKAFAGYLPLGDSESASLQQVSMTAVTMVCRFFQGWKRSHPFMIGCSNYLQDYLPRWMKGLEKGMAVAWYHYYWYYGTLAMHQMGGKYWRAWNQRIKRMYPEKQRKSPPELAGSWDPDTAVLNGGRVFSTAMSILSLESYYRFSPLMDQSVDTEEDEDEKDDDEDKKDGEE